MPAAKYSHIYKIPIILGALVCAAVISLPLIHNTYTAFSGIPSASASLRHGADLAQSFSGAYLAGSYAANQGSPAADAYFRRALSFRPQDTFAKRALLLSLIDNGNFTEAVRRAEIIKNDSDASIRPVVQLVLAANAFKTQDYARVQNAVRDKNGNETHLWVFFTAWAEFARGQKVKAIQSLQQARFSEWYVFLSLYNIALMQDLSGVEKNASVAYEKALGYKQLAEIAPETYEHLLYAYTALTQRSKGANAALKQLDSFENTLDGKSPLLQKLRTDLQQNKIVPRLINTPTEGAAEFAYAIGSTFLRAGEEMYADIYLQTALFLRPDDDGTLFRLGILAAKAQQSERLRKYFARISPASPYYKDAELLQALNINQNFADQDIADKKNDMNSVKELEQMIARSHDKTELQNVLANMYLQGERYQDAITLLDTMLSTTDKAEKRAWSLYFQRGIAYERDKNWQSAEKDFQAALQLNPQNADVLNYYGYSLIDRTIQLEKGLSMVKKAAESRPQDSAIMDSLGWAYYKLGRYDEAVAVLEKAVRLSPAESSLNDHLGDAYWRTGKKLDAVFQWNHALTFQPEEKDMPSIQAKLRHGLPENDKSASMASANEKQNL